MSLILPGASWEVGAGDLPAGFGLNPGKPRAERTTGRRWRGRGRL